MTRSAGGGPPGWPTTGFSRAMRLLLRCVGDVCPILAAAPSSGGTGPLQRGNRLIDWSRRVTAHLLSPSLPPTDKNEACETRADTRETSTFGPELTPFGQSSRPGEHHT